MTNLRPFFTNLIVILINLGCFMIFATSRHQSCSKPPRKPPCSLPFLRTSPTKLKRHKSISSSWSFIKQIFSSKPLSQVTQIPSSPPSSSTRSLSVAWPGPFIQPDYEIHPCPICGEVFNKQLSLEQHQSIKHSIYELSDDDPSKNVAWIIFETGWPGKSPTINRVMKIHNNPKILTRFEEYRESVKSKAARHRGSWRRDERCIADGNELLRFHCTTFLCDLGQNGNFSICTHQCCSVCGIIGSGFSPKLDGISTFSNSWKGHVAIPEDIEDEFGFMNVKRAMLVCRVIVGRVGCDRGIGDKDDPDYDSLMGREHGVGQTKLDDDDDEVIVFSPWAVLPCFVIVYSL